MNSVQMCSYRNGEKSQVGVGEARLDADDRTVTVVQSGAYFWSRVGLHKTFRVYEGSQDALLSAIRQELSGLSFICYEERLVSYISVPSRIYMLCTSSSSPLSSFRSSAKAISNIEDVRKSAGCLDK